MRPDSGSSAASILPSSARQAWKHVHRVALAEQEAIAPPLRRVVELQEVEEQRRHQVGARQRAAEVAVLLRGDRHDVAPQRGRAPPQGVVCVRYEP